MKKIRMTIWMVSTVLVTAAGQGFGDIYLNDGATHNINYTVNDYVWVDYQAPGMQTGA
jgi:hypothetical protein